MADLEAMGLLYAPHTSAGRVPTERGLRLFVDGLLEIGELAPDERVAIEARINGTGRGLEDVLTQATTHAVGPFALRRAGRRGQTGCGAQACRISSASRRARRWSSWSREDGQVENRLIDTPSGLPCSALSEAANYLNARLARAHAGCGAQPKSWRSSKANAPSSMR